MRLWQQVEEVGGPLAMRMTFILLKTLPYALLVLIAIPVSFFYWVIDGKGRKAVVSYLESIGRINGRKYHSYPLFLSFAISIVEKGKSWIGSIDERNLIFSDDDPSMQMQRLMKQMGGSDMPEIRPLLEINPDSPVIARIENSDDEDYIAALSSVLLDQAMLQEGVMPSDPAAFAAALTKLLS